MGDSEQRAEGSWDPAGVVVGGKVVGRKQRVWNADQSWPKEEQL